MPEALSAAPLSAGLYPAVLFIREGREEHESIKAKFILGVMGDR